MNNKDFNKSTNTTPWLRAAATAFLLVQFLLFLLLYNYESNIYLLGIGWLLLAAGLGFVLVSSRQGQTLSDIIVDPSSISNSIPYSMHFGWILVSLSLSLIVQQWYAFLLVIGFIAVIIFEIRSMNRQS